MKGNSIKILVAGSLLTLLLIGCNGGSENADAAPKGPAAPQGTVAPGTLTPEQKAAAIDKANAAGGPAAAADKGGDDKGN